MTMKQFVLTPAMGKRLIGKGMAAHPAIQAVLKKGTLVIIAGTTNGYVAEEVLAAVGQAEGFSRGGFRRGMTIPPGMSAKAVQAEFPGDVVLVDGKWQRGKTVFDAADGLKAGDVVLKGGNALDLAGRQAGVYIGHPQAGTIGAVIGAVTGRRIRLIVPIGLEKRVAAGIMELAALINAPDTAGPGMLPLPGEVFTELDAVSTLAGARACLLAGGGVHGAEGAVWIGVAGTAEQVQAAGDLLAGLAGEPPCQP
jgi:hypothetical protein